MCSERWHHSKWASLGQCVSETVFNTHNTQRTLAAHTQHTPSRPRAEQRLAELVEGSRARRERTHSLDTQQERDKDVSDLYGEREPRTQPRNKTKYPDGDINKACVCAIGHMVSSYACHGPGRQRVRGRARRVRHVQEVLAWERRRERAPHLRVSGTAHSHVSLQRRQMSLGLRAVAAFLHTWCVCCE